MLKDDGDLDEDPPVMMMMTTNSDSGSSRTWYLDSGCSNHMTGHRNWLVNFDDSKRSVIRLADNRTIAAQGMGDVLISKKDGSNALLSDVLFVPGIKSNLVSIGQLVEKGFKLADCGVLKFCVPHKT